jgi:BlaI family transcriptional regulator, penicillinase repressor
MKKPNKELTRAEEEVMQILWKLRKAFVKDIVENFGNPKPAYNTVSTIIRILEKKGFVSYKAYGNTHEYYPLMSKKQYTKTYLQNFVKNYFSNSYQNLVSFFTNEDNVSLKELEEMKQLMEKEIKKKKKND